MHRGEVDDCKEAVIKGNIFLLMDISF